MSGHTPGPWTWRGEDYRGGWGYQVLVGANGEGIACGAEWDGGRPVPYRHLPAFLPIDPSHCKTGFYRREDSAPPIHVRQADAALIAAAPDLLAACKRADQALEDLRDADLWLDAITKVKLAIAKAKGELS